jgi:hypothetical protein
MNAMFRIFTGADGFAGLPGPANKILSLQAEKAGLGYSAHLVFSENLASPVILSLPKLEIPVREIFRSEPAGDSGNSVKPLETDHAENS